MYYCPDCRLRRSANDIPTGGNLSRHTSAEFISGGSCRPGYLVKSNIMKLMRTLAVTIALSSAGGVMMVFLNSCSTTPDAVVAPLEIPGAHYVGNQACADCHKDIVRIFPASPHARIHSGDAAMVGQSGCESCHGPGSKHIEAGGGGNFIINPGKDPASCFQCHLDVNAEFNLPHHHPVIEGHMNCVQCHDPHGGDIFKPAGGLAMARQDESCTAMSSRPVTSVCFRAPGDARRLHRLPQPTWFDQSENAC